MPYPAERDGHPVPPLEGQSLLSAMTGRQWSRQVPLFWEHEGNRAVRDGPWKLVSQHGSDWELYDMVSDRTEINDLAEGNRGIVERLKGSCQAWADRCGAVPWPPRPGMDRCDGTTYRRRS